MRILTTAKLSQHKYKTPEGYLVCVDSILSRTGKQQYRRSEVWGDSCDRPEEIVDIDRTSNEVFSDAALASFENKPLTIDHPGVEVNPENHRELSVGFVRDIKRGVVDGQEVMLGTLVVTDSEAIRLIEDGTYTDLSCGYDCDIEDEENPTQKNIRGNHVALCEEGRAGIAKIVDSNKVEDASYMLELYTTHGGNPERIYSSSLNELEIKAVEASETKKYSDIVIAKHGINGPSTINSWSKSDGWYKIPMNGFGHHSKDSKIEDATISWYSYKGPRNSGKESVSGVKLQELLSNFEKTMNDKGLDPNSVIIESITVDGTEYCYGKRFSSLKDSKLEDAYEQMKMPKKDKDFIKNYLRMISTFTSRDTDISDVLRPLYGHGYKCVIEKIDGWHDPKGAYAYKNYTVSFENYIDRFNVTLYADPAQDWKVKEVNAYFLDSINDGFKPGDKIQHVEGDTEIIEKIINEDTFNGKIVKKYVMKSGRKYLAEDIEKSWHKVNDSVKDAANRYVLAKRKNSYDEYVVRAYQNGKYFEESTYYTDDWDDAVGTLEDIAKREGLTVKKTATGYIAE